MELIVIGSSSKGNCYLLKGEKESLIIECGVPMQEIKKALDFDLSEVVGCLVSHVHMDHAGAIRQVSGCGIPIYTSDDVINKFNLKNCTSIPISSVSIGESFRVHRFDLVHDVPTLGFYIYHPECGYVLFATDTSELLWRIPDLNNIIIESNYCEEILEQKAEYGNQYVTDRVKRSHMSLQECTRFLKDNDLKDVQNIVLIHLSDSNSDEKRFKTTIEQATGKPTFVAAPGMRIDFNNKPF
jgi:phosphoribosyl 1,2-cyclic phosphodiesterase